MKKTVLVIDDYASVRRYHAGLLRQMGHTALEAANGSEGLAQVESEKVDLVLLDLIMPGVGGAEFLRRLRGSRGINARVPVIAVTSEQEAPDVSQIESLGVSATLVKPVFPDKLKGAIESVLGAAV